MGHFISKAIMQKVDKNRSVDLAQTKEWILEGTNIGFGMILRPLQATWQELLKDLEKKKDDMVLVRLHFDFFYSKS